jgi:hypothetical protein
MCWELLPLKSHPAWQWPALSPQEGRADSRQGLGQLSRQVTQGTLPTWLPLALMRTFKSQSIQASYLYHGKGSDQRNDRNACGNTSARQHVCPSSPKRPDCPSLRYSLIPSFSFRKTGRAFHVWEDSQLETAVPRARTMKPGWDTVTRRGSQKPRDFTLLCGLGTGHEWSSRHNKVQGDPGSRIWVVAGSKSVGPVWPSRWSILWLILAILLKGHALSQRWIPFHSFTSPSREACAMRHVIRLPAGFLVLPLLGFWESLLFWDSPCESHCYPEIAHVTLLALESSVTCNQESWPLQPLKCLLLISKELPNCMWTPSVPLREELNIALAFAMPWFPLHNPQGRPSTSFETPA